MRMKNMSEKVLLKKLKIVGNPFVLLKMMNDSRVFINNHQIDFPKNADQAIYIQVDEKFYQLDKAELKKHSEVRAGNYIFISDRALLNVKKLLSLNPDASLSAVFSQLRKARNIKQYKELFQAVEEDFKTNLKMVDLVEIAIKLANKK